MPAVVKIDPQRRVICSTFYGEANDEELLRHRSAIAEDPNFDPTFSEIVDFSGVTKPEISEATLRAMASTTSLFNKSVLHIIVAPAELAFRLASSYQALARETRPNLLVVRSLSEAHALLRAQPST